MKTLLKQFMVCAFLISAFTTGAVHAQDCQYDVVGITITSPEVQLIPDGRVTFGMQYWWEDDVYACYETHRQPAAYMTYFSACDFDGSGAVEIQEVIDMYNFVLLYPTGGVPAYSYSCPPPPNGCRSAADCGSGEYCQFEAADQCGTMDFGTCETGPDACALSGEWVCGCDGESYTSSCLAALGGTSVYYEGFCL